MPLCQLSLTLLEPVVKCAKRSFVVIRFVYHARESQRDVTDGFSRIFSILLSSVVVSGKWPHPKAGLEGQDKCSIARH